MKLKPNDTLLSEMVFFTLSLLLLAIQILTFMLDVPVNYFSLHSNIFIAIADAAVFLCPWILIKPRFRWTIIFPMVLIPVILLVNLLYYRNFQDFISLRSVFSLSSYNSFVFTSGLSSLKLTDIVFGGCTLLFGLIFFWFGVRRFEVVYPLKVKLIALAGVLFLFLGEIGFLQATMLRHWGAWGKEYSFEKQKWIISEHLGSTRGNRLRFTGLPVYMISETVMSFRPRPKLSEKEKLEAVALRKRLANQPPILCNVPDNSHKNLIVVVVESLNSQVLSLSTSDGKPLFPYLDSLTNLPNALLFTRMRHQVGEGRSSDANLIYTTGLLPIPDEAVATEYAEQEFPSLPRALGRHAIEIIAEPSVIWNHGRTSVGYGYQRLYGESGGNRKPGQRADSACFEEALRILPSLPKPFMAAIFTIDQHDPYNFSDRPRRPFSRLPNSSEGEHIYLERTALFEEGLKLFIEGLHREGLYDNSVIVIVSDHNAREWCLGGELLTDPSVMVLILNSGVSPMPMNMRDEVEIAQVDFFPTILDIFDSPYSWHGFGRSLLRDPRIFKERVLSGQPSDNVLPADYPCEDAWRISERLIKTQSLSLLTDSP